MLNTQLNRYFHRAYNLSGVPHLTAVQCLVNILHNNAHHVAYKNSTVTAVLLYV
jgi:hypothetical protein